jgi:hypothetical protein
MAQFAPVAPIGILEEMKKQGCLGTYHLLLAHHVLEFPERFRALFADLRGCTIIMDNSLVELGASENEQKVLDACKAIQDAASTPNYIIPVLTDVMGDGAATREASTKSYKWWRENAPMYPLMVATQGGDKTEEHRDGNNISHTFTFAWKDFCHTVDHFLLSEEFKGISYVGVPRKLVEFLGTRQLAIQYIDAVRPDISVHLLGFSDDVTDDIICAQHPSVEGIDSAVPIRFGYNLEGNKIYTPSKEIPPRPKDWFEKGEYDDSVFTNLYNIRKWVA